jgi:hypothetical protein
MDGDCTLPIQSRPGAVFSPPGGYTADNSETDACTSRPCALAVKSRASKLPSALGVMSDAEKTLAHPGRFYFLFQLNFVLVFVSE